MTRRKFYGTHFHSLTTHAPEVYRLFCLRSLVPEQEERSFGELRMISERTSNRQCGKIIDNCMMRFMAQNNNNNKLDVIRRQDSTIRQQANQLPKMSNTTISLQLIKSRPSLIQAHLARIADFLLLGENVWWSLKDDNVIFHDGPEEQSHREGPQVHHFRSSSLEKENEFVNKQWEECIARFENRTLNLPASKIKLFKDGKLHKILHNKDLFDAPRDQLFTNEVPVSEDRPVSNGADDLLLEGPISKIAPVVSSDLLFTNEVPVSEDRPVSNGADDLLLEGPISKIAPVVSSAQSEATKEVPCTDSIDESTRPLLPNISFNNESNDIVEDDHNSTVPDQIHIDTAADAPNTQVSRDSIVELPRTSSPTDVHMEAAHVVAVPRQNNTTLNFQAPFPVPTNTLTVIDLKRDRFPNTSAAPNPKVNVADPSKKDGTLKSAKRRLFRTSESKVEESSSTIEVLQSVLGDTQDVKDFIRYRRLLNTYPSDRTFRNSYDTAKARVQISLSAAHRTLKGPGKRQIRLSVEKLLQHWGVYYF